MLGFHEQPLRSEEARFFLQEKVLYLNTSKGHRWSKRSSLQGKPGADTHPNWSIRNKSIYNIQTAICYFLNIQLCQVYDVLVE